MDKCIEIEAFYHIFRDISTSVHSCSDINEVLDMVVKKSTDVVQAKGAVLRILNRDTGELELNAVYGLSQQYLAKGHVSSPKVITDLCRLNKIIIIDNVQTDPRVQYPREARDEGIDMMLDLPLTLGPNVVGIIRFFFARKRRFTDEELNFLQSIAEQCALAIDKARLIEKQQSQYEHLAIQTEKLSALGRMAAGIAHEINNPLGGILLYSTNMLKKVPKESSLRDGLQIVVDETLRCKNIIQDLLEFSRDKEPLRTMADINEVIAKSVGILENEFRLEHIEVKQDLLNDMPEILIDTNQLEQVFVNLLINAVEAIGDSGAITIRSCLGPDGNSVRAVITDTGCGIDREQMGKIFEPFFSTKSKGTGLGLAVSYGIVRNHQGDIRVTSRPGKGTSFTVMLPMLQKDDAAQAGGH